MTSRIGERTRFHSLALIACALFLAAGLAIVDDYGASPDTRGQRLVAIDTLNYVLRYDPDPPLLRTHDRFYGAALELPLLLLTERALGLEDPRHVYLSRHVLTHLWFLIGGFCCYLLARRLSGDRLTALLVMLLFLLSPRLYAHSFFNSKDPAFASAFVMALLFASRAFDKDSLGAYRWCGAAAGLLVSLRVMGAVLFAAVLVFRLWAWFRAGEPAARRRAAATAGVFALWGGLALFISLPYLWGDPAGRLAEMVVVLADHPGTVHNLFRGKVFSGAALPWDYVLRWFAISQPPVTLLLGLLGIGALGLAAKDVVKRGEGGGVAELRFGVLLATCFALPLVVFALLRPNAYHGWRHFYFLHGPFCLLATFALMGLRQLPAPGLRKEWVSGAACALTAAGLGVVVVQMAQIHPHQYLYFNLLADRKTPERLRAWYDMDYWNLMLRQGYEHILRQAPASAVNMRQRAFPALTDIYRSAQILPAAARSRFTYDPARDPDFYLESNAINPPLGSIVDPGALTDYSSLPPVLHRFKIYNNTIMTLSTPDLSRVDPAVAEAYRALHRAATAGEPAAMAGGFDIYLHGKRLAWVKEACEPGKLLFPFRLALYPADARHVPDPLRKQGYIELAPRGVRFDGKCLGTTQLPDFALARIRLRQPVPYKPMLLEADIHL